MTTAQQSPNGHRVLPPPFPVENPSEAHSADFPTDKANINSEPLNSQISDLRSPDVAPAFTPNGYHFPPQRYASKANPYQYDDFASGQTDAAPLPDRCQFMFSDGRQCTMARSDIHPSLCRYHSEREEQLFGDPVSGGRVVGAACDLPELFSACRDLTTAAGVNRALAQVFRLLAQRRISRQEAATFAKLGHLLLRSIAAARADAASIGVLSEQRERRIQPELSPRNKVVDATSPVILSESASGGERRISPKLAPERIISPSSSPLRDPVPSQHHKDGASGHQPAPCEMPTTNAAPLPASNDQHLSAPNPDARNSRKISTSEFAALKPVHNQHLQNNAKKVGAERG